MYLMKHYHIPAPAFIGWIRICRPGSVLGPQQQFLCKRQEAMFEEGKDSPIFQNLDPELQEFINNFSVSFTSISPLNPRN